MTVRLRSAEPLDGPRIFDLLLEAQSIEWPEVAVNAAKARKEIADVIRDGMAIVAEENEEVVGSVGLRLSDWWFSDELFWLMPWIYVRKDRRRSRIGVKLILAVRRFAVRQPVPVIPTLFTRTDTTRKSVLFSRYFEPLGGAYMVRRP